MKITSDSPRKKSGGRTDPDTAKTVPRCVLTINGGSSSIRFAIYEVGKQAQPRLAGKIDRVGSTGTELTFSDPKSKRPTAHLLTSSERRDVRKFLFDWLETHPLFPSVQAVGHRVVHGMKFFKPEKVTAHLLEQLRRITPFDPDHLPQEIALIETVAQRHPGLAQIACFDTAFHRSMPAVAKILPLPRRYAAKGIERYGFHGLSYAYLMEELSRLDPAAANGRIVLAHLGNGASLAAVHHGKSVDTSMGFTPTAGLVMSTRTGDLDPGVFYYLARSEHMSPAQFQHMVNHESGLRGVSGTSADVRDLLAREGRDVRAAEAIELFCYQARKWIGAYAAALGGLDTLVFAGGIGENATVIRERICEKLDFLGIKLSRKRNARSEPVISKGDDRVKVRVIRTDEELMIARSVMRVLKLN